MKKNIALLMTLFALVVNPVMACQEVEGGDLMFLPENDMQIPVGMKSAGVMTEQEFNNVIDQVEKIYIPEFSKINRRLKIKRKWATNTVNAMARKGFLFGWKNAHVYMYGGLARHPKISIDGFAMVLCHEIGHHLAGAPLVGSSMSNEGQSDYFAATKCFRKSFEMDNNRAIVSKMNVPTAITASCSQAFNMDSQVALCERSSMAGITLASVLNSMSKGTMPVKLDTPSKAVVATTYNKHPKAQCRLDTYVAGAICDKDRNDAVSKTDASTGYCMRSEGYTTSVRPLCWYKPTM
jgi:hypothetical protein